MTAGRSRLPLLAALLVCISGAALGTWQIQRLFWKHALIAQVDQRIHALPVAAPARAEWPRITSADYAYRRVRIDGTFLNESATAVQAVTEYGAGFWQLVPLRRTDDGSVVLINRGFVATAQPTPSLSTGQGIVSVTGLLRLSEPGGGFLRKNQPASNRWYSRDVEAIAKARGVTDVAPYFIDADASLTDTAAPMQPRGGLTVVHFSDNHLVYALTWYTLALMAAGAAVWLCNGGHANHDVGDDD